MTIDDTEAFSEKVETASSPDAEQGPVSDEQLETASQEFEAASAESVELGRTENQSTRKGSRRFTRDIPELGEAWRWYDIPYRALNKLAMRRGYWQKIPSSVRRAIIRVQSSLMQRHRYDYEKAARYTNPLRNLIVPEGEKVSLPNFWLVEYYSPSHAEELMRRIKNGKWDQTSFLKRGPTEDAVRQGRERESSLGIYPIATLVTPDYEGFHPDALRVRIPEPFQSISLTLMPIGSALTAVVGRFDLTESAAASLDEALRADHQPRLHKEMGRLRVTERLFVGLKAVQTKREELHQAGRDWLASELPGLFATEAQANHPALDLLVTRRFNPFKEDKQEPAFSNFGRALGLNEEPFSQMYSPEWKRVRIMEYSFETNDGHSRDAGLAFVTKFDDALGRKHKFWRGGNERSERAIASELDYGAPGLMTRYGLFHLLELKQEAVAHARDQASTLHSRKPVKSAKNLRQSVLKSSLDMATIARDIESLAATPRRYEWEVPSLAGRQRKKDVWSKWEDGILKDWADRQAKAARRLADLDRELLGILDIASNLNASIEGIRSQRWSLFVAFLSLASSGAAVWFAYLALTAPFPACDC